MSHSFQLIRTHNFKTYLCCIWNQSNDLTSLQLRKYFTQIPSFVIHIAGHNCSKNSDLKSKAGIDKVFNQRLSLNPITTVLAPFLVFGYIGVVSYSSPSYDDICSFEMDISRRPPFPSGLYYLLFFNGSIKKRSDIIKTSGTGTRFVVYTCAPDCSKFFI